LIRSEFTPGGAGTGSRGGERRRRTNGEGGVGDPSTPNIEGEKSKKPPKEKEKLNFAKHGQEDKNNHQRDKTVQKA